MLRIITLIFFSACIGQAAIIYQIYNLDGSITFTTRKPKPGEKYKIFTGGKNFSILKPYPAEAPAEYKKHIHLAAKLYNLNPNLIKAIIKVESNFNPLAKSPKGAMGLMQLMPQTVDLLKVKNPYDVQENILGGSKYLRHLLNKYNNNLILSLAAYNAGPQVVDQRGGVPPFPETKNYIKKVLRYYNHYQSLG